MYNQNTFTGPSFSIRNRFIRLIWTMVVTLLFRYSPNFFFKWRVFLLRCFGAKIGNGVHIYPRAKIWAPWNIEIGDQCGIANGCILYSQGKIIIGQKTVVSQSAHLVTGTHDYTQSGFPLITKPITIGDNVWIATEVFIHPGINIGNGCIIGARSVVTKDMPAWMVCAGHPCRPMKQRILM
jgi:putative colanic acid biosynthesis acetyltransferase WcaF